MPKKEPPKCTEQIVKKNATKYALKRLKIIISPIFTPKNYIL